MSTTIFPLPDTASQVVPAPFDADQADRDYARTVRARATIAGARDLLERFEAQRPDIEADIARRQARLLETPEAPRAAMPEEEAAGAGRIRACA